MKIGKWARLPAKPPFIRNRAVLAGFAVWGAIFSSVALGAGLFRYIARRGKLRVLCFIDDKGSEPPRLLWNVTNVGTDSVVLARLGATLQDGGEVTAAARLVLPHTLRPGEFAVGQAPLTALVNQVRDLWAEDGRGRRSFLPSAALRRLKHLRGI